MFRFSVFTLALSVALGSASAQVVSNGGYATTAPYPAPPQIVNTVTELGIPSVPAINTPVAHVGPTLEGQNLTTTGATTASTEQPATTQTTAAPQINLGVAVVDVNPFVVGSTDSSQKPLGDIARQWKQKEQTTNAKNFTNADIDKLNQPTSGGITGAATANRANDNWPANNGVITPPATNNGQGSVAAPMTATPSTTGNSPFAPKSQNYTPDNGSTNPPQANAKPSAGRPYETAANNPSSAGIPQQEAQAGTTADNSSAKTAQLPKTASRLPLVGVLGFFSISMGLFVRYQRNKSH